MKVIFKIRLKKIKKEPDTLNRIHLLRKAPQYRRQTTTHTAMMAPQTLSIITRVSGEKIKYMFLCITTIKPVKITKQNQKSVSTVKSLQSQITLFSISWYYNCKLQMYSNGWRTLLLQLWWLSCSRPCLMLC